MVLQDFLDALVCRSYAKSSLGAQLENAQRLYTEDRKDDSHLTARPRTCYDASDPHRIRDQLHDKLLSDADLYRCIDGLRDVGRCSFIKDTGLIATVARKSGVAEGHLAIGILSAYQEWGTQSGERALVAVYDYLRKVAPREFPPILHDETNAHQAFREGKAKKARRVAAELYADAFLIAQKWVERWNKPRYKNTPKGLRSVGPKTGRTLAS